MRSPWRNTTAWLLLLLGAIALPLRGQAPRIERNAADEALSNASGWMTAGASHVARQELEQMRASLPTAEKQRSALLILMRSTFADQEYEDAYQWSTEFIREYPNDAEYASALFTQGVSAFQTRRLNRSLSSLEEFLSIARNDRRTPAAHFWHAMARLDQGDWTSAETDLKATYRDSTASGYNDVALMGWALSLERRGAYQDAIDRLEEFLQRFPRSSLLPDVKIRLASLSLRTGNPVRARNLLDGTSPDNRIQRQEYELLGPEANVRLGKFGIARSEYAQFVKDFPDSRYQRYARYGLGWSYLKLGNYSAAQAVFDSLGKGNDSLAFASLYQSGVLALLQDKPNDALVRFDLLTDKSPYDVFAENAYIQMGMTRYRSKHYRDARRHFQLAAQLFPESRQRASSYRMLGETNVALSDFSNAQYDFSQVRRLKGSKDILAPSMFQEGVCLYHLGRFRSSADMFTSYLQQFPNDARASEGYVWKGEALYQDYRFADAERAYTDALRKFPSNPKKADAAYGIAWSQFEQKKFSQAAASFERFMNDFRGDQRSLEASLRQADCFFFLGQYEKAQAMYAHLSSAKADSRNVEYAAFQLAMSYIQRGESQRGIEELRSFIGRFPSSMYDEVAQFNIGWEYFSREQYAAALPELRTVVYKYPASQLMPRVLFNMGDAYYNLKQYDSAHTYYQRVINEYPQSLLVPDALNGLQFTYEAQGRPAGALAEIDTILAARTINTPKEDLLLRKGDILFGQGDYAGAIQQYQQILSLKPKPDVEAKALNQLGRSYEMQNNPQRAVSYYRQVITNFPQTDIAPRVALSLGITEMKSKQYRDALSVLENFPQRFRDSSLYSEAAYNYGIALAGLPDRGAALAQFGMVIQQYPNDVFADRSRLRIADLLSQKKEYRPALDTLGSIMSRRSDDIAAEALVDIGEIYLSMRKYVDALQAFNDVIKQYTDLPLALDKARLGTGQAYEKLKDRKRARAAYQELAATAVDPDLKKEAQDRVRRLRK